jgi:predicted transcriptional regulator
MAEDIQTVLEFWNENKAVFERDRNDFRRSKSFASGDGFEGVSNKLWSANRARIFADFISPVVDSAISLLENSSPEITNYELDKSLANEIFQETLEDGKSFMLVYHEGQSLKLKKLSNLQTYMSDDCKKALHVSKISKAAAEAKGKKITQASSPIGEAFVNAISLGKDEMHMLTYYEQKNGIVEISEFAGGELLGQPTRLKLGSLPLVCFHGRKVFIDNKVNYRGLYYKVKDILLTMSFLLSFVQEKVTANPNAQFMAPEESLGDNQQQWENLNGEPQALLTYRSRDYIEDQVVQLPPPQRIDQRLFTGEPLEVLTKFEDILSRILGAADGGEKKGTETAEAVLLRRDSKEAGGNYFIRNLVSGLKTVAKTMAEYSENVLGVAAAFEVADKYFEKMKRERDTEIILSLMQIAEKSPAFAAAIAEKTELDADTVQKVQAAVDVQNLLNNAKQTEAQAAQAMAALQQAQAQIQSLNDALRDAQQTIFTLEVDSKTKLGTKQMQEEAEIRKESIRQQAETEREFARLAWEREKFSLEHNLDLQKTADKKEIDVAKIELEAIGKMKEISEDSQMEIPNIPGGTNGTDGTNY